MKNIYDLAIVGSGVSGVFSALRLVEKHPDSKFILFDISSGSGKRRRQLEGFLGALPGGDTKLYPGDIELVKNLVDGRKAIPAYKWAYDWLAESGPMKITKNSKVSAIAKKALKESNFEINYHDYIQWKPDNVHAFSKLTSERFKESDNITFSFDNEVFSVVKQNNQFLLSTQEGDVICKKVLLCVGRSGWRWATNLYYDLGLIQNDDFAQYGVVIESTAGLLKEYKKAHCSLTKGDLTLGPLNWNGTIIPEDHSDLVISAFRSNEDRWKSDKVSLSLTKKIYFKEAGCYQADRIGKLLFLLFNDRVAKEKIKTYLSGSSMLNIVPEYNWLKESLEQVESIMPGMYKKGFLHTPNLIPKPAEIRIGDNLETEIDGMFVAGECAGIRGILAAATMGVIVADSACK